MIATLKELLDNARDGEAGFLEAAQHTHTASLGTLFARRAQACREDAAELQELIAIAPARRPRRRQPLELAGAINGRA